MTEPKLYGIERADGTVSQDIEDFAIDVLFPLDPDHRVVEVVAVKKERLDALYARLEWIHENEGDPVATTFALNAPDGEVLSALSALRIGR